MQLALEWSVVMGKRRPRAAPKTNDGFGARLAQLRRARGLTQEDLGALVGLSSRMVAYYEREDAQPPGPLLTAFTQALKVSLEELLGVKPIKDGTSPRTARLLKRLKKLEDLPPVDQRAVLKMVDALHEARRRGGRP